MTSKYKAIEAFLKQERLARLKLAKEAGVFAISYVDYGVGVDDFLWESEAPANADDTFIINDRVYIKVDFLIQAYSH